MASQNVTELERKLKIFFTNDIRFRFVKKLPSGATGNCVCFEERHPQTGNTRQIVLKYPGDDGETTLDAMKNEISWLQVSNAPRIYRNSKGEKLIEIDFVV